MPIGHKDADLGKWSPNWEGPLIIQNIVIGGAYILKGEDGQVFKRPINGIYLKKFYPSTWESLSQQERKAVLKTAGVEET